MVREGKVSSKCKFRKKFRSNDKGSDDSDEDYVVSDEENEVSDYSDEDYHSSVDGQASEESFGNFVEEEEEEEEERVVKRAKKVGRSKSKKRMSRFIVEEEEDEEDKEAEEEGAMKKVKKVGRSKLKKHKSRFIVEEEEYEEEEEEEDEDKDGDENEDEEMNEFMKTARSKVQRGLSKLQKNGVKPSQKRRITYKEDEDDDDDEEFTLNNDEEEEEEEEDDDDDEFTPDDDECSDEEESRAKGKKNSKAGKQVLRKNGPIRSRKRRRKSMASKKRLRKKAKKTRGFRRKARSDDADDGDFIDNGLVLREKGEMKRGQKKRRYTVPSDSDFVSSGSSEYEYTISEEEREQVREAREYCRRLKTNLRNSSMSNKIPEDVVLQPERKPTVRKGKEKVEELKAEIGKRVCGICLSEEDKRKVRGTLNCCTHYFCFSCIMEWAKVESRCPLCKQRFNTISKPARNTAGIDLREVVLQVPERDQVYQPSEEELRSYIDPYENVICTECHEGGDDGLMLLCDLCDSPAHTYCVGLGQEVPDGNWYCEGCRPFVTGSSSSVAQTRFSEQRTSNTVTDRSSTVTNHFGEGLDLNSVSSQGFGSLSSPRYHFGGFQATSPLPGAGAPTLSGRRMIHRHIQQLLSGTRIGHLADRHEGNSGANYIADLLNSPFDQGRETLRQRANTQEMELPFHAFFQERLRENPSTAVQDANLLSPRISQGRRQMGQDPTTVSVDGPSNGSLWPGLAERNLPSNYEQQLRQCNGRSNNGCDWEASDLHTAKEQLHSMIKSHLKNLSRDTNLAQSTLMDIVRSSTNTILAACELEHKSNEVVAVPVSPPPICGHIELMACSKASLMRGRCSSCFDSFIGEVVKKILDTKLSEQWLSLGL